jgi:NADH-quinone oxidoreductase subunit G
MTVAKQADGAPDSDRAVPEGHVRLTIDGREVHAPQGELVIRACERLGIIVPRFCDHPLLEPAGASGSAWLRWRWAGDRCPSRRPAAL